MKERWLTLILRLTNRIYAGKQTGLGRQGVASIINIFSLIWLEFVLAIISLPLYLTTSATKTTAFLREKGGYAKITVDYNLRRVLTLTGVGVVLFIWAIKFMVIMLAPTVYGPLQLYSVSELAPATIAEREMIIQDTGMQTARKTDLLPVPSIDGVEKSKANTYRFWGIGEPGVEIVMFLSGRQNLMYSSIVVEDGTWQLEHSQSDFRLLDGVYSIFAFHYNKDQGIRSEATHGDYFRLRSSLSERLTENFDSLANWLVVVIIMAGVLLTFLTL